MSRPYEEPPMRMTIPMYGLCEVSGRLCDAVADAMKLGPTLKRSDIDLISMRLMKMIDKGILECRGVTPSTLSVWPARGVSFKEAVEAYEVVIALDPDIQTTRPAAPHHWRHAVAVRLAKKGNGT